ncbi:MAG: hypothetical protein IJ906_15530 [Oscillospiraceae bacterium]|nr:hypothetical protein [Oscillospiraceae bacterium]
MNYRVKGYAANPLIVGGVCLVIGVAVGVGATYWYMSTHQGGLGDGETNELFQETAVTDVLIEETDETVTEPPSTEPVTENLSYIKVVVKGNNYLYKGEIYTLEAFLGIVRANSELPVRISEDGASMRAYSRLIDALKELGTDYVESRN